MAKPNLRILLALLPLLSSCVASPLATPLGQAPAPRIDHIIVGVSNLEAGIRDFERLTGVRAAPGGAHPGRGTQNALLSLGEGVYLEIYAPNPAEPVVSPAVTELQSLRRMKPLGWAVAIDGIDAVRSYFAGRGLPLSAAEAGSRVRPDGSVLEWVTFGFASFDHPLAPFFIRWAQRELHPSRTSPTGCRLVSIRLRDPSPSQLRAAVEPLGLGVAVARGAEKQMEVRLACPRGAITLS